MYGRTRPYDGMPELLSELQRRGALLAVASNKYQQATEKLVAHFFPKIKFISVLGQREGIPVKPDPAIVYDILAKASVEADEVLYVGDSDVDMQTAAAARVLSVGVVWGFRSREELECAGAGYLVDRRMRYWIFTSEDKYGLKKAAPVSHEKDAA